MIKFLLILLYGLIPLWVGAQTDYSALDEQARTIRKSEFKNPEEVALALCQNLPSERAKARVLFTWLTHNMRYNYAETERNTRATSQAELERQRIQKAFRSGKGVCMDYALLYQKMAQTVGLECEYVRGHAKSSVQGGWEKHAWNAVKIDKKWVLLDPTWGSGFSESPKKFTQIFQAGFFDTPPHVFALNHFPADAQWQLLDNPLSQKQFEAQDVFNYGNPLSDIQDAIPLGTPLSKNKDGKVVLKLKIANPPPIFVLQSGNRTLLFDRIDEAGWTTLQWPYQRGAKVSVWGGEKQKNGVKTNLMGIFTVH